MARRHILSMGAAVLGFVASAFPVPAGERAGFRVSVMVAGAAAPEYSFRERTYIEALRGKTFTVRLSNPTGERVGVALSVDGLNVVDAKRTTSLAAAKWVIEPWQTIQIPGWQISGETARRFFFTDTARSYAKWIGDTRNVGTIEAVFFREKRRPIAVPVTVAPAEPETRIMGGTLRENRRSADSPASAAPPSSANESVSVEGETDAATGIGDRTRFPIRWVDFDEDPVPVASLSIRYEYRRELVRLGVLSREDDLYARDRGRGFEHEYAPDPGRRR